MTSSLPHLPNALRSLKRFMLSASDYSGVTALLGSTEWRRQRLLILGYHGISLGDEHEWKPDLYLPPELFRRRLELLRRFDCNVLPLGEAVERLYAGTLPERSVVLTFDDGYYDFYRLAYPMLAEYGYPATVYLTTFYSEFNRPIFDVGCEYLLWKGCGRTLDWPDLFDAPVELNASSRPHAARHIKNFALKHDCTAEEKDALLAELAWHVGVDYQELCDRRVLHLMTPSEAREVASNGIDLQLHTHRHRTSRQKSFFVREIDQNRERLLNIGSADPKHFCYPGGLHLPEFLPWLQERKVVSATSCHTGMASVSDHPLLLPRLMDACDLGSEEFMAWVSGFAAMLPARPHPASMDQLAGDSPERVNHRGPFSGTKALPVPTLAAQR